tara:strand:- start:325 stop:576 length:252 start_codon:yes stop_codon:yes gene_type:complete
MDKEKQETCINCGYTGPKDDFNETGETADCWNCFEYSISRPASFPAEAENMKLDDGDCIYCGCPEEGAIGCCEASFLANKISY